MRLRLLASQNRKPMSKREATSEPKRSASADSSSPESVNSIRRKNSPPSGSEVCWSDCTMFAPASNKKPDTALTMPGWSAHQTSSRFTPASIRSVTYSGCRQFGDELVLVEALERERRDQVGRALRGDELGERLAHDRRRLEAVSAPARAHVEVVHLGLAEDRAVVGAQVAQPGPRAQEPSVLELREELERMAREVLKEV